MLYSPILFSQIADLNLTQYHSCDIDINYLNSKERIIIFSLNSMLYLEKLTPFIDDIKVPFILITAMEDTQLPLEIDVDFMDKIKSSIFFKHWFAVNKTIPNNDFFTSIPYGLNYWTFSSGQTIEDYNAQNMEIENIRKNQEHFSHRINKIYANYHLNCTDSRHGGWRRKLVNIIPKEIIYYQPDILPRNESHYNMSKYAFVVSPFGNGFDCIRTFEALCLGCIVIMKKSFLDIIYEDLPVLLVDEWSDINETLLNKTLEEYSTKQFNYYKLEMDYWIKLVNSRFYTSEDLYQ